jgi:hypothetical protein
VPTVIQSAPQTTREQLLEQKVKALEDRERRMSSSGNSSLISLAFIGICVVGIGYAAYNRFGKTSEPIKAQEHVAEIATSPDPSVAPEPTPAIAPQAAPLATPTSQQQALTIRVDEYCPSSETCIQAAVMQQPDMFSRPVGGLKNGSKVIPTGQKAADQFDPTAKWVQISEYTATDGTVFKNTWVSECYVDGNCSRSKNVGAL